MGRFIDYIPPDFLANLSTEKFVKVLDILHLDKANEVNKFNNLFNHKLNTNTKFLEKFVVEVTGWELPSGMPKKILENILYNIEDLFEFKGTLKGLKLLFQVLTDGDVIIDTSNYLKSVDYIIPNSIVEGYLPSDEDYLILTGAAEGTFLYLYEDSIETTNGSIVIKVISPYSHIKELRQFMEKLILEFLPFSDPTSLNVDIYYYNYVYLSNQRLKNYTYGN